jgi:hypothetical protein
VWSEEARGPVVKVVLQTDESVQDWGLCIDKVASEAPPEPEEEEPERPSGREPDRATPTPTSTKVPVQAPPPPTATPVAPPLIWSANNAYLPFITKGKVAP